MKVKEHIACFLAIYCKFHTMKYVKLDLKLCVVRFILRCFILFYFFYNCLRNSCWGFLSSKYLFYYICQNVLYQHKTVFLQEETAVGFIGQIFFH